MKYLLVLIALMSSTAFGMVDTKHFNWQYTYEGKTFYFTSETKDWYKEMPIAAVECMKFFKADPKKDPVRYEILAGECVNPH